MPRSAKTKQSATSMHIMVVEDDQFLARALTSKLKKEGFSVQALRSGDEVIAELKKSVPDMLLLDLIIPHKDGFTVLEEIRSEVKLKKLPVIVLSNLGQTPDTVATKKLGALEHLVKADTPLSTIVDRVKHHLAKDS